MVEQRLHHVPDPTAVLHTGAGRAEGLSAGCEALVAGGRGRVVVSMGSADRRGVRRSPGVVSGRSLMMGLGGDRLDDEPQAALLEMLLRVGLQCFSSTRRQRMLGAACVGGSQDGLTCLASSSCYSSPLHHVHLPANHPHPPRHSPPYRILGRLIIPPHQAFINRLPALQDLSAHHASSDRSVPEGGSGTGEAFREGIERERESL